MMSLFERFLVYPAPPRAGVELQPDGLAFEDVYFRGDDGTTLHAWYVPHPSPRAVILYNHGNGVDVPRLAGRLQVLHDRIGASVLAWDYRGYGQSEGKPHEENLIADGRVALDLLAELAEVPPTSIVLMGRSLGGGVAVALAAETPVGGLVLDRTFSRLTDTAAAHYPWLPVRWLMQNRFPSIERIASYDGPLLQTHGTEDRIIPFELAEQLFAAAPSAKKQFIRIEGGDHNGPLPDECYDALEEFLEGI